MLMSDMPSAKVLFRVPDDEGGTMVETIWAVPLGEERFVLENSPFFAYGVSWQDTILAPFDEREGMHAFQRVLKKSGNRTIRVIFDPPVSPGNASDEVLQGLVGLGCSYEGANPTYVSINIPPDIVLEHVCSFLIDREAQWEHADPTHESLYPNEA